MATFVALLTFTEKGEAHVKESPERAEAFRAKAEKLGCKVKEVLWTLGAFDGVLIFDAPDDQAAAAALLSLEALGNVRTQTLRAFTGGEMKAIVAKAFSA